MPHRIQSYDALSVLSQALTTNSGVPGPMSESIRDASQISTLLQLVRNTTQEPFQKIPQPTAVFLAEASVAGLNPSAFLYAPINSYLLKRAVLPQRGLSMFTQLHDGRMHDWRRRRVHAQALAAAAPQAAAPRGKLAAAAMVTMADSAAAFAFLHAAAASAALPATCVHMLRRGTLAHVAACVVGSISQLAGGMQSHKPSTSRLGESHVTNALTGLEVLCSAVHASQLWRGSTWRSAVATYTSAISSILGVLADLARLKTSDASNTRTPNVLVLLRGLLKLLRSYLRSANAWHHSSSHQCSFPLPFWQQLLRLAMVVRESGDLIRTTSFGRTDVFAVLKQCLMCSSLASIYRCDVDNNNFRNQFPSRDAQCFLQQLWTCADADRDCQAEDETVQSEDPHAVRLLTWIFAGVCQHIVSSKLDGHKGVIRAQPCPGGVCQSVNSNQVHCGSDTQ